MRDVLGINRRMAKSYMDNARTKKGTKGGTKEGNKESAVAPVVAMLMILSILLTVYTAFIVVVIPNEKELLEIKNIDDVEKNFISFSSDIEMALLMKNEGSISKSFTLGSGDTFLSATKSGGVLEVNPGKTLLTITNTTSNCTNSSLVNFSYKTVGNFYQECGYLWDCGSVYLITTSGKPTPLLYTDETAVRKAVSDNSIFKSLIELEYKDKFTHTQQEGYIDSVNNTFVTTQPGGINKTCSELIITIATMRVGEDDYMSGNSVGALTLNCVNTATSYNESVINFDFWYDEENLQSITNYAYIPLVKSLNQQLKEFEDQGYENVEEVYYYPELPPDDRSEGLYIKFADDMVKVTIKEYILTVSAL